MRLFSQFIFSPKLMPNCKSLIYNSAQQEAITPIHANLLVKWDVARSPRTIAQQHVPFHWQIIPQAVLLPDLERLAIAHNGIQQSYIDIYSWEDLSCIEQIAVPHSAYEEIDDRDPFSGHDRTPSLSHLSITPCGMDSFKAAVVGRLQRESCLRSRLKRDGDRISRNRCCL
jgi:hypothetical protein